MSGEGQLGFNAVLNGYSRAGQLFGKGTLPTVKWRRSSMDRSQDMKTVKVKSNGNLKIKCIFNQPFHGTNARFVKPVKNPYSASMGTTYANFHWMPMKNQYFKTCAFQSTIPDVKEHGLSFKGLSDNSLKLRNAPLSNHGHLLWFPRVVKAHDTMQKLRCSCIMTTKIHFRLYGKAPIGNCAYQYDTAYYIPHHTIESYNTVDKYPITGI